MHEGTRWANFSLRPRSAPVVTGRAEPRQPGSVQARQRPSLVVPFALANGPEIALTDHIGDRQFAMFWVDDVLKPDMAHPGKDLRSEDDYVGATEDHVSNIPAPGGKCNDDGRGADSPRATGRAPSSYLPLGWPLQYDSRPPCAVAGAMSTLTRAS